MTRLCFATVTLLAIVAVSVKLIYGQIDDEGTGVCEDDGVCACSTHGVGKCDANGALTGDQHCRHFCIETRNYTAFRCTVLDDQRNGKAECQCGTGICSSSQAWGDPHFQSFDRSTGFTHHGQLLDRHILLRSKGLDADLPDFTVYGTNTCWAGDCVNLVPGTYFSSIRTVELQVFGGSFLVSFGAARGWELTVKINGLPHVQFPYKFVAAPPYQGFVYIERIGVGYGDLKISTSFGVTLHMVSWLLRVHVPYTNEFIGNLEGLMGNLDGDVSNDMMTPDGTIMGDANGLEWESEESVDISNRYMQTWLTDESARTRPIKTGGKPAFKPAARRLAKQICHEDFDRVFENCFLGLTYDARFFMNGYSDLAKQACEFDVLAIDKPQSATMSGACESFDMFATVCAHINPYADVPYWRSASFCPAICDIPNTHFEQCIGCQPTCNESKKNFLVKSCGDGCESSGCACNKGFVLDEANNRCVRKGQCGGGAAKGGKGR